MPDLGKYAAEVLSAYAVSLVLLAVIIIVSVVQARGAKRRLDEAEARRAASPADPAKTEAPAGG